jgi:hypothetical protein
MPDTALSLLSSPQPLTERAALMKPIDKNKQARMVVSDRLRVFFNQLKEQLTAGAEELWNRVETKLNDDRKRQ